MTHCTDCDVQRADLWPCSWCCAPLCPPCTFDGLCDLCHDDASDPAYLERLAREYQEGC